MRLKGRLAVVGVMAALIAGGCGGSSGHPDTGAGAHQTPPATQNCMDACQRLADCVAILCDEDTMSTRYQASVPFFVDDCLSTCTDANAMSMITPTEWTCLFESSCRQLLELHVCEKNSSYHCS